MLRSCLNTSFCLQSHTQSCIPVDCAIFSPLYDQSPVESLANVKRDITSNYIFIEENSDKFDIPIERIDDTAFSVSHHVVYEGDALHDSAVELHQDIELKSQSSSWAANNQQQQEDCICIMNIESLLKRTNPTDRGHFRSSVDVDIK